MRHNSAPENPTNPTLLIKEIKDLTELKNLGLLTAETYGITKHRGIASIVMKKYEGGDFKNSLGHRVIKNLKDELFETTDGLKDLIKIRKVTDEQKFEIADLQFLISKEGRVHIDDVG